MSIGEIITQYRQSGTLSAEQASSIVHNHRKAIVEEFRSAPDRKFAYDLLIQLIIARKKGDTALGSINNLMLGCYLIALHGHVEDASLIWQTKSIDFDTYHSIDIALMVFAGITATLEHLKTLQTQEARKAIDYIRECAEAETLEEPDHYFSPDQLPDWV